MAETFHIPHQCKLYTAENSRIADRMTIDEFGIDGFTLMEIAAYSAAGHIIKNEKKLRKGLIICGKGNNAGDALAVARYLINDAGHEIIIYPVFGTDDLSQDAEKNLKLLKTLEKNGASLKIIDDVEDLNLYSFDYCVDGIFGTGLNSSINKPLSDLFERLNSSELTVYSMDVPSGLNADTGEIHGTCLKAHKTFTFGTNKIGFHLSNAQAYCGDVVYIKLPFPNYVLHESAVLINSELYNNLPPNLHKPNHKYDGGVVHIVAGSEGLTGAAIMAAKSAWKQGAGAVFLYAPKKLLPVYEIALPQIIKIAVGSENDTFFKEDHLQTILSAIERKKGVLLIGPGIGTRPETRSLVQSLLLNFNDDVIIDADALAAWQEIKMLSDKQKKNWLLTPHQGESEKWLGNTSKNDAERFKWVVNFSKEQNCNLFLKGYPAFLAVTKSTPFITGYNTSIFNRAGFGDVLAGAISAKIAIDKSIQTGTIRALYETFSALSSSNSEKMTAPENLL